MKSEYLTVNLSGYNFSESTFKLLEKGLSFVPRPAKIQLSHIIEGQEKLVRSIKINSVFCSRDNPAEGRAPGPGNKNKNKNINNKKFIEPRRWDPPSYMIPQNTAKTVDYIRDSTSQIVDNIAQCTSKNKNRQTDSSNQHYKIQDDDYLYTWFINNKDPDNLTPGERSALYELKNNNDIIIKPADKGGATVIMDRLTYQKEAERQLNNEKYYKKIDTTLAQDNKKIITETFTKILNNKYITKPQFQYLTGPEDFNIRTFYMLPKIHKPKSKWPAVNMPEGRPIISDVNSESYRTAEYLDYFINPLSLKNDSILKNSYEFVEKIRGRTFPQGYLLVTGDVKSLYTNMNLDRILDCVRGAFIEFPDPGRPDSEILELLHFTLFHNDFSFNGQQYLQVHGTAMGKKYAPGLANLYLKSFDTAAKTGFKYNPELYFRFLDDVFFIWGWGKKILLEFQSFLNNLIPDIEITFEFHEREIPFLDVLLYVNNNKIETKTYFKTTDTHQLLHTNSYHPIHTTKGLLKSQFVRFKRLSSTLEDYNNTCLTLYSFLRHRGYSASQFRKLKYEVWHDTTMSNTVHNTEDEKPILPIVMPYSNVTKGLNHKYKQVIKNDPSFSNHRTISAYKIYPNLKNMLVRAKFSNNPSKISNCYNNNGFNRCTSTKCTFCLRHAIDTKNFTSTSNRKRFQIKNRITCTSRDLIYLISCKKCHIQYIGETGMPMRTRLNNHISNIRNKIDTTVSAHFNSAGHSILNLQAIAIEMMDPSNQNITRKQRESFWIKTLQTYTPLGLNILST